MQDEWEKCGFDAMQMVDLLAQGDICGGHFLEGIPMDWIQASYK